MLLQALLLPLLLLLETMCEDNIEVCELKSVTGINDHNLGAPE